MVTTKINGKKGMGAFLVATLVILLLIFVMFMLLGFISKTQKDPAKLADFVNRNYYKKDLLLFLDSPIETSQSDFVGMSMAEMTVLHFSELKEFEKKMNDKLDITTLSDTEKLYYAYFYRATELSASFCSKYKKVSKCNLELFTFKDNKKIKLTFPKETLLQRMFPGLDIKTLNQIIPYTLAEMNFYGPDGTEYTLRSNLAEPLNSINLDDVNVGGNN